jgi:hypothetical protein
VTTVPQADAYLEARLLRILYEVDEDATTVYVINVAVTA